jgi:hypothetical protein
MHQKTKQQNKAAEQSSRTKQQNKAAEQSSRTKQQNKAAEQSSRTKQQNKAAEPTSLDALIPDAVVTIKATSTRGSSMSSMRAPLQHGRPRYSGKTIVVAQSGT